MTPNQVTVANQHLVWLSRYGKLKKSKKPAKFKTGDCVRVAIKHLSPFSKAFTQTYSEEIFYVKQVSCVYVLLCIIC